MKFDVKAIAEQVADRIIGKLDATPHAFRNKQFNEDPDCVEAVSAELDFLLQMDLDILVFQKLVGDVLDAPSVQMAFNYAERVVSDYNQELLQQQDELKYQNEQYVKDVL